MEKSLNEMLLDALLCVKQVPRGQRRNLGLCQDCIKFCFPHYGMQAVTDRLHILFQLWPKFSGQEDFPIPDPSGKEDPYDIFSRTYSQENQWYGPYGDLRVELLDFLIEILKDIIAGRIGNYPYPPEAIDQAPALDVVRGHSISVIFVDDIK